MYDLEIENNLNKTYVEKCQGRFMSIKRSEFSKKVQPPLTFFADNAKTFAEFHGRGVIYFSVPNTTLNDFASKMSRDVSHFFM